MQRENWEFETHRSPHERSASERGPGTLFCVCRPVIAHGAAQRRVEYRVGDVGLFDRETWLFINGFAPWLAALGTLLAVIVSLHLARRASRLDIRVFADFDPLKRFS